MKPQDFRTIFSYFAFPAPNEKRTETTSILAFNDVEMDMSLEQLESAAEKGYQRFLESGKSRSLSLYESEQANIPNIEQIFKNDEVLQRIEKEFKELNEKAKEKNKNHHILN